MSKRIIYIILFGVLIFGVFFVQSYALDNEIATPSLTEKDTAYQNANDLYAKGKYKEAVEAYKKLAVKYPNDVGIYFNEGLALKKLGNYQGALGCFQKVISINAQSIPACVEMADTYEKLNNSKEAQVWYQKAVSMTPQSALSYYYRGTAYKKLGNEQAAKDDFSQAFEQDPRFQDLAKKYNLTPNTTQEETQTSPQTPKTVSTGQKIVQFLNSGYNKYLVIFVILVIIVDVILMTLRRKRTKKMLLANATLDFIQIDLGLYTFNTENDIVDYIDKTQKLIAGWETQRVRECLDKLNGKYWILDHEIVKKLRTVLQRELEFRAFD